MFKQNKRYPAFDDTLCLLVNTKVKLWLMVPPHYLRWLWGEIKDYSKGYTEESFLKINSVLHENIKLANYIWNSHEAIKQELGDTII